MKTMRLIATALLVICLGPLAGCGCLETDVDQRIGGGGPDPDQPAWHRCIFGTRYLPYTPPLERPEPDPDQPTWQRQLFGPRYRPERLYGGKSVPPPHVPPDVMPMEPSPNISEFR
jgi:hypothetical protein